MNEKYGGLVSNPRNTKDTYVMQSITRTFGGGTVTTNPVIREEIPAPDLSINPYPIQDGFYAAGESSTNFPFFPYYIVVKCTVKDNELYVEVPKESWYYLADPITYEIIPFSETQLDISAGEAANVADEVVRQLYIGRNPKYDKVHTEYGEGGVPAQVHGIFAMTPIDRRQLYTVVVESDTAAGGTVTGGGTYAKGTVVYVTAAEKVGYIFLGWYEGSVKVSDDVTYHFTVEGARTLVAKFKYGNNIIPYEASAKLSDLEYQGMFGDATVISHTFEDGFGKIKFDKDVEVIQGSVFSGKTELTSIKFPESLTSIGDYAFGNCSGLTSVVIPDSVTSIGEAAFHGCSGLTSAIIGNGVTSINNHIFNSCSNLTSVIIPNSVTSIGIAAFDSCSGLTAVTIPNSVTSIGSYAFYNCINLVSITIPNSVTYIGTDAFQGCTGLTSPVYNETVFAYMPTSYSGTYTIPNGIQEIVGNAFYNCTGLTSINLGNGVTTIGYDAFSGCSGLTSITIPESVTSIGKSAFSGCSNLASVTCEATTPPTLGSNAFESNASGRKIYVPAASVDTYKAASGWNVYAADIKAIPAPPTPVSLKTSGGQNVWCESKDGYTEVTFNHNSFNGKWNGYYGDDWVANLPSGKKHRFVFTFHSGVSSDLTLHFIVATDNYGDWNDGTKVVDEVIEAGATSFQYDVNNTSYKYIQLVNTGTSGAKLGVVSVIREEINV